ncbi:MAG: hypothetical protein LRZ85_08525 [Alphaproteobacteria bacterium]|nr:hypothetical protein [Alphaproteobacteria bacterium]
MDTNVRISDLLRKALLVARKLKIPDIETWVLSELNGYETEEIPKYRHVRGEIKAFNTYNGVWMPIMFSESDTHTHRTLTHRTCSQPVSELEALIENGSGQLGMRYTPEIEARLMRAADMPFPPMLLVSESSLHGILDCVRTTILEWALKLEEQGIVGENLSFSQKEKEAASTVTINVETMSYSQIQAGTVNSSQSMENEIDFGQLNEFIERLEKSLSELTLDKEQAAELSSEVSTVKAQTASPKPKQNIIKESLRSIRTILEGAAGNISADGLLEIMSNINF